MKFFNYLTAVKQTIVTAVCWISLSTIMLADTVDFEDLGLPANSFVNGSNLSEDFFTSGGAEFTNDYSTQYSSWRGWSYSSMHDVTTPGYENQYSAYVASEDGSNAYGVGFVYDPRKSVIRLPEGQEPVSFDVANTTYAALSMMNGDGFAQKFEEGDSLKLAIRGEILLGSNPGSYFALAEKIVTLAEFSGGAEYILSDWQTVDLSSMQDLGITQLSFELISTDFFPGDPTSINTPAYFAMDNLVLQGPNTDPLFPGDANRDDSVTREDLKIILSHYGKDTSSLSYEEQWDSGDFDHDGAVDLDDLLTAKQYYGSDISSSSAPTAVPEPASMILLLFGLITLGFIRARRRKTTF